SATRDWSLDVCSSDLDVTRIINQAQWARPTIELSVGRGPQYRDKSILCLVVLVAAEQRHLLFIQRRQIAFQLFDFFAKRVHILEIGRASCRELLCVTA